MSGRELLELLRRRLKYKREVRNILRDFYGVASGVGNLVRPVTFEETYSKFPEKATTEKYAIMGLPTTKEELIAKLKLQDPNEYLKEMTIKDIQEVLNLDIKMDNDTKTILYLLTLLTYTKDGQQNVDMTGQPSSGKTWMVTHVVLLFPFVDIDPNAGCTPHAFHYSTSRVLMHMANDDKVHPILEPIDWSRKPTKDSSDEEKQAWRNYKIKFVWLLDLKQKIVVFTDLPNYKLSENLRSVRAHDLEYSKYEAVDVNRKTESTYVKGFWTEIVCTAFALQKQEEKDRAWHLNPEWNEEKETQVMDFLDKCKSDPLFKSQILNNPKRLMLQYRIQAVKDAWIDEIYIPEDVMLKARKNFDERFTEVCPRKSREYDRYQKLVMACALNNFAHRITEVINVDGSTVDMANKETESLESLMEGSRKIIWANMKDCDEALELYLPMIEALAIGISPEAMELFDKVVEPLLAKHGELEGVTIRDVTRKFREVFKRTMQKDRLEQFMKTFADLSLVHEQIGKGSIPTKYFRMKEEPKPQEIHEQEYPQEPSQKHNDKLCPKCQKAIPEDGSFTTFIEGKTYHIECYKQMKLEGET